MSNSYRIRTEVGKDKFINVLLEQDFEYLEILSLKILQSQIYNRLCSDYGVIAGRITANSGFGLPNCKVSIFIPLSDEDRNNPIISDLYPYRTISDTNDDGYRYNLLPYVKSHSGHNPTGSFPDRIDVLTDSNVIEVYEKYYKFTAKTNESGDYMIFGIPLGTQTIHVDIDLSDIGEFSLAPQDLIRLGLATETQVAGTQFRSSTDLNTLPQIISFNRTINIEPLWGDLNVCTVGITRSDFDITSEAGINITPTAIFMGSIFSNGNDQFQTKRCRPKVKSGDLCNLITAPGEILAIRQTIQIDNTGKPILEVYELESGGQVIDDNGTWLVDVPMNLDYVTTNEFGERIISDDPNVGIPTRGKYRFKIKWNQSPTLSEDIKRGYFLVPNVREYGWQEGSDFDPLNSDDWPGGSSNAVFQQVHPLAVKSYSFSLDWDDYVDPSSAIRCDDTFYLMSFNKVYTVSQLIDQFRRGFLPSEFIGIKNNLDESCESDNLKFPNNDAVYRFDLLFLLFRIFLPIFRLVLLGLLPVIHVLAFVLLIVGPILAIIVGIFLTVFIPLCLLVRTIVNGLRSIGIRLSPVTCPSISDALDIVKDLATLYKLLSGISLPLLTYPQCTLCPCNSDSLANAGVPDTSGLQQAAGESGIYSLLSPFMLGTEYQIPDFANGGVEADFQPNIQYLLAGEGYDSTSPSGKARVPQYAPYYQDVNNCGCDNDNPCDVSFFTTNLTLAERINLFNVKAKYFDNGPDNPGGSVNRIKVTFNNQANNPNVKYHLDNVVVISCVPGSENNFTPGQIITFQDPTLSQDININGFVDLNQFGTQSVTGGTLYTGTSETRTIYYANPNGSDVPLQVDYTGLVLTADSATNFHKFPIDIEYYQVITATTYGNYTGLCNTMTFDPITLNNRFLGNDSVIRAINEKWGYNDYYDVDGSYPPSFVFNPMKIFKDSEKQVIVFLVRGVDPNSSRQPNTYDLSRLFGYDLDANGLPQGQVVVNGNYKLNIPIQPSTANNTSFTRGLRAVRHNFGLTGTTGNILVDSDVFTGIKLYYDSFQFSLATSGLAKFSGFSSNLPTFYSSLGTETSNSFRPFDAPNSFNLGTFTEPSFGVSRPFEVLKIQSPGTEIISPFTSQLVLPQTNPNYYGFTVEFDRKVGEIQNFLLSFPCPENVFWAGVNTYPTSSRGYYVNEVLDGGSVMGQVTKEINAPFQRGFYADGWYFSPRYNNGYRFENPGTPAGVRKIVMRSDRLPTSTSVTDVAGNSFALQNNLLFSIFSFTDDGSVTPNQSPPTDADGGAFENFAEDFPNPIFETFTCEKAVPLRCYDGTGNEIVVKPGSDPCYKNLVDGRNILVKGCYKLVTFIFGTLINGRDFFLVFEWVKRLNINFGACRNVWSHLFTNNWVNGTLYAFAFKNDRIFDAQNRPFSVYCKKTIFLHPTNNFYYRSSPYYTGTTSGFIGAKPSEFIFGATYGGNKRNLKFPTTMIDLGPRTQYLQELIFSDEFDGYIMNKLKDSSYTDVSEILNLLIISRLTSSGFWDIGNLIESDNNILSFFNARQPSKTMVDGDYAQMISISSEIGIATFEASNYPQDIGGQDPIYFPVPSLLPIFGIFFSADTQLRDFITPKRKIINPSANLGSVCAFSDIPVFSQEVPFYQWEIKEGFETPDNIFGVQGNDWYTRGLFPSPEGNLFFSRKYQSMDRLNMNSRYFRYNGNTESSGFIYAYSNGDEDPSRPIWSHNNPDENTVTVGAPFHFYFGLKKGKTAFDRFTRKWINFSVITD